MKRTGLFLALFVLLGAGVARSQETENVMPEPQPESSPGVAGEASAAASRNYPHEHSRNVNSKSPSRPSRAEFEANQRTRRLEAMRWYGMSNSRPVVTPTPLFGTYSPMWVSGGYDPSRWQYGDPTPDFTLRAVRPRYLLRY